MSNTYFVTRFQNVPLQKKDWLTKHAFAAGATGTSEVLEFEQPDLVYEPSVRNRRLSTLEAYFDSPPKAPWIEDLRRKLPGLEVGVFEKPNEDWMSEWKKGFKPFCLVADTWIVPSWTEPPVEAKSVIRIDPGMAFGTGTHETTQLAAKLMDQLKNEKISSVLDVGTGTGILAILSTMYWQAKVVGIDIDPEARRTARENWQLHVASNAYDGFSVSDDDLAEVNGEFDLVVANIIDGVLVKLSDQIHARASCYILLSGILLERESSFQEFFRPGWRVLRRETMNEWVAYLLEPILLR